MDQASSQSSELPTIRVVSDVNTRGRLVLPDGTFPQLGNYRLIQRIAEGGFAEVYLGEHIYLNTFAAIKVIHTHLEQHDLEEFRKEASIVARLRHPHIISVHDFDVRDGTPFLVMDYAPNGTLRQRHPRGSKLPPATILPYLKQVAEGLQYAHDLRFIHRDVKPENMLLDERDMILLSDFGIAVVSSTHSQSDREVVGTISYMAPEQLQGKPVLASDQYSLGIVLYEWLSGDCPFKGSLGEIAAQHVNTPPPSLIERVPDLPFLMEGVVMRALAKSPAERFSTVMELAHAFESSLQAQRLRLSPSGMLRSLSQEEEPGPYAPTILVKPSVLLDVPVEEKQRQKALPRRTILAGLAGLATLGLAGGFTTWFLAMHRQIQSPPSSPTVQPSSTSIPPGTLFHTYRGHHDSVLGVASSSDSAYVASASRDMTVQVWDTATGGNNAATYTGHTDAVTSVAWSPDQKHVVSGSSDKTARVWNTADGSTLFSYTNHSDAVNAVEWSPDGTLIASGSTDKTVQVWAFADGSNAFSYTGHSDAVYALSWSPDGSRVASGSADSTVQVWNADDGSKPFTFSLHSAAVFAVAWSPDGMLIASGGADKTVRVWQPDGTPVYIYGGHTNEVSGLAWSPDGKLIASASQDGTVQVWGARDGSSPYTYTGHGTAVNAVTWLPAPGTLVVSGSADTTVEIWQGEQA
jgi:eukaryotic-like serine/threonine-protein kinase